MCATTAFTFSTSQLPEVVPEWCVLYILTSKCASRHKGVHFFDISTSKKWSEPGVLCTFWLRNVLRATTACNCWSLIWPAGSAPAALASLLFDPPEPQKSLENHSVSRLSYLFAHPASSFFWLFLFSDLLSSTLLFSLTLPISALHVSILSEVWLLNFLRSKTSYRKCFLKATFHPNLRPAQRTEETQHHPLPQNVHSCTAAQCSSLSVSSGNGRNMWETPVKTC